MPIKAIPFQGSRHFANLRLLSDLLKFRLLGGRNLCCFYTATPRLSHLSIGGRNYRENSISYLPLDDMRSWGDRRLPTLSFRCLSLPCAFPLTFLVFVFVSFLFLFFPLFNFFLKKKLKKRKQKKKKRISARNCYLSLLLLSLPLFASLSA